MCFPSQTCLLNAVFGVALSLAASQATEFVQDFTSVQQMEDLRGDGAGQFNFVDRAGPAVELSIVDGAFQADVAYDESNPDPQNSGVRLTRLTPVVHGANFLVVRCKLEIIPKSWPRPRQSIFNLVVGENFRATPYSPAREHREDEGPTFAAIMLSAGRADGDFFFFAGQRESSGVFTVAVGPESRYVFPLVFAFNSGTDPIDFDSPSGGGAIPPGTFSIWLGDLPVWEHAPSQHPQTKLENFSFGLGRGTDSTAAEGATSEGVFRISDIKVTASAN